MPENNSYFAFSYRFPTAGTYTVTAEAPIEGEEITFRTQQQVAAPATSAEDTSLSEPGDTPGTQQAKTGSVADTRRTKTGNEHDALLWKLTTIQFFSGASVVVAAGALWAAVLAYRGTD